MLHSAITILEKFTSGLSLYKFYHFEMIDIDVEECGYLCYINSKWFFIYETDFLIIDLPKVLQEISYIFDKHEMTPLHWLAKKDSLPNSSSMPLDTSVEDDKSLYDALVYRDENTHLIYTVLEVAELR